MERKSSAEKLLYLYEHHHQFDITQVIQNQYPLLSSFAEFIHLLIENWVYIDNEFILSSFILTKEEQKEAIHQAELRSKYLANK